MAAATTDRNTPERAGQDFALPVEAASKIFAGTIVCLNAAGNAVKGATATTLKAVGISTEQVDNVGAAGSLTVPVKRGVFRFANSAAADQITAADYGATCFIVDDQTVAKTNGAATRSAAGVVRGVEGGNVWVEF